MKEERINDVGQFAYRKRRYKVGQFSSLEIKFREKFLRAVFQPVLKFIRNAFLPGIYSQGFVSFILISEKCIFLKHIFQRYAFALNMRHFTIVEVDLRILFLNLTYRARKIGYKRHLHIRK